MRGIFLLLRITSFYNLIHRKTSRHSHRGKQYLCGFNARKCQIWLILEFQTLRDPRLGLRAYHPYHRGPRRSIETVVSTQRAV